MKFVNFVTGPTPPSAAILAVRADGDNPNLSHLGTANMAR